MRLHAEVSSGEPEGKISGKVSGKILILSIRREDFGEDSMISIKGELEGEDGAKNFPSSWGKMGGNITAAERNTSSRTQYRGQYTPLPHMGTDVVLRASSQWKTEGDSRGRWGI